MVGEDESYDLVHFEFIVRAAGRIRRAHPALAPHVSVTLHCEIADILTAYTQRVARDGSLAGLRAYSAARPPQAEGLAVRTAGYLVHETETARMWWGRRGAALSRARTPRRAPSAWPPRLGGPAAPSSTAIHRFSRIPSLSTSWG